MVPDSKPVKEWARVHDGDREQEAREVGSKLPKGPYGPKGISKGYFMTFSHGMGAESSFQ